MSLLSPTLRVILDAFLINDTLKMIEILSTYGFSDVLHLIRHGKFISILEKNFKYNAF